MLEMHLKKAGISLGSDHYLLQGIISGRYNHLDLLLHKVLQAPKAEVEGPGSPSSGI